MCPEYKTTTPRSKGKVICDACFTTIPQGTQYRRDTWKDGTYHWSCRYCPDCWEILPRVQDTCPGKAGPWAPQFEAWADSNKEDTDAERWSRRAFPRN